MNKRILFVDDEKNLLEGYKRNLRKEYEVSIATSGKEALKMISENLPFSVIISDMRMPEMDGVEFLSKVKEIRPDTTRMLLTGYADVESAINVINEGNIFRFLTKPCTIPIIKRMINDAINQYELVISQKTILDRTFKGTIKILNEILSMSSPLIFGHASRVKRLSLKLAKTLKIKNTWNLEIAAMLSQIGALTLTDELSEKVYKLKKLNEKETIMSLKVPIIGSKLLKQIPHLEKVSEIIKYQNQPYSGSGNRVDNTLGEDISIEARILKVANDYYKLLLSGLDSKQSYIEITNHPEQYDSKIISKLQNVISYEDNISVKTVYIRQLRNDMILNEDIISQKGKILLGKGLKLTESMIIRIQNFDKQEGINQPIRVLIDN